MRRYKPSKESLERLMQIERTADTMADVPADTPDDMAAMLEVFSDWKLSPEHVAAALGISSRTLRKLRIPHARIGMTVRYHPKHVRQYIRTSLSEDRAMPEAEAGSLEKDGHF